MKTKITTIALTLNLLLVSTSSLAANDLIYYAIGEGAVLSAPAREDHLVSKTLGLNWEMNLQCGLLDPSVTVKNQLNGITKGFQDMMGNVLKNATSAVMSLPGYFLQKEDPGLYDLLTNGVLQGKFDFDNGKTSCEAMTKAMGEKLASNEWTELSQGHAWTKAVKTGDAVQAKIDAEKSQGNKGIVWAGGRSSGGRSQPAIMVTGDTAKAGFTMLTDGQSKAKKEGLYRYWDNKEAMAEWLTGIIGETTHQTGTDKTQEGAKAGIGLSAEVNTIAKALHQELQAAIYQGQGSATFPPAFIQALKADPARDVLQTRVASEVAFSQTIDKALLARRTLLAGKNEVYISQHTLAQKAIAHALSQLEQDIQFLQFEATVRKQFSSHIVDEVIRRNQHRSQQLTPGTPSQPSTFEQGKFGSAS
ncbi:integrating conjugative element protein [Photobacterium leiognathi]|uniref:integrating conjugative element protein n=1 Tax=Photobacterium leiognathi TaxID=553611 RepID=UPI002739AECD|nr:integrating conjugative element protein [Photobacterium leiognathi]